MENTDDFDFAALLAPENAAAIPEAAFECVLPPKPGTNIELLGRTFVLPAPPVREVLDLQKVAQMAETGQISQTELAGYLLKVCAKTLRRNYPALPAQWFGELDIFDLIRIFRAIEGVYRSAGETKANP